jgi:hypothetical protein
LEGGFESRGFKKELIVKLGIILIESRREWSGQILLVGFSYRSDQIYTLRPYRAEKLRLFALMGLNCWGGGNIYPLVASL